MATLFQRGKVWYSRIRIQGEEIRKPLSTDKKIAEERLGDLIKERNAARHGHVPANARWQPFRDQLLKASMENKKRSTWLAEIRAFRELEAVFPVQRINQITPMVLEEIVKPTWIARKRGKYVINRDLRTIRGAMRKAEAYGYAPIQNWTTNRYIKTPKGRLHFWTVAQLLELRNVCLGAWRTLLYLGSRAGLRREEIRELPWQHVDFEQNLITIAPFGEWIPKDYECRDIPMAKDLREFLLSIRRDETYVFSDDGFRPTKGSMTTYFARLVRKAKQKGSVHTLRHTFGAHLASAGTPLQYIKAWMGHSDIETTEIYSHLMPDSTHQAIHMMPQLPGAS